MMSPFDKAIDYTFENEGGFSNDEYDHGGATKYGIIASDLAAYRKRPVSEKDVENLTADEAKLIYKAQYWDSLCLDQVTDDAKAICLFDIGVVQGIERAAMYAQQACNKLGGMKLNLDGVIGAQSVLAINSVPAAQFVPYCSQLMKSRFKAIACRDWTQVRFLRGWCERADRLLSLVPR